MFDSLLKNCRIVDGTGNPSYHADLAVKDGRIAAISNTLSRDCCECSAKEVIDVRGMVVSPGFVDIHSHSDFTIVLDPRAQSKVQQGITTELTGQCGHSAAPQGGEGTKRDLDMLKNYGAVGTIKWISMYGYLDHLASLKPAINQAILTGHGTLRGSAMGYARREPTPEELGHMKLLLRECMKAGSFGLSTGLYYAPGSYSKTPEVAELCREVAELGGLHCSHLRDESDYNIGLIAALKEVCDIARGSGVSTQVAHLKALGPKQWGKGPRLLDMIEEVRAEGYDVTFDQYPYPASGSGITGALLPRWAQEGGRAETLKRMADPDTRAKMLRDMCENLERRGGAERLLISSYQPDRSLQGKTLAQVAGERNLHPIELSLQLLEKGEASFVCFVMSDEDVETIMRHPAGMVGTDGYALASDGITSVTHPHPRSYGTYPRILGHYVREKKTIHLEEAIRKMTLAPATKMGLIDRGMLRVGAWADIVVFDPATIKDEATFDKPQLYPTGIKRVIVNGETVVLDGQHQNVFPGHVLRKKC